MLVRIVLTQIQLAPSIFQISYVIDLYLPKKQKPSAMEEGTYLMDFIISKESGSVPIYQEAHMERLN